MASRVASIAVMAAVCGAFDPLEILPPGISSGLSAKIADETPYTLNLFPPEESRLETAGGIDAVMEAEKQREAGIVSSAVAGKQRLLSAEVARIHDMVNGARRHSLLQTSSIYGTAVRKADFEVDLHEPSESGADIDASMASILRTESGRSAAMSSADASLKQQMIAAELNKIKAIVHGGMRAAFLEPFVPPIAVQEVMQASLPTQVSIDYDVPSAGVVGALKALKHASMGQAARSFLEKADGSKIYLLKEGEAQDIYYPASFVKLIGDDSPRSMPSLNVNIETPAVGAFGTSASMAAIRNLQTELAQVQN